MESGKTVVVLGEKIEVLVPGEATNGASALLIQTSPPGGGPPPHRHAKEDEYFSVLEGKFEMLIEGEWEPVLNGQTIFAPRDHWHTFRNAGETDGRMQIMVSPAGLEKYFDEISPLVLPQDKQRLLEISARYGIEFMPPA
jgi:quercetin dioxygenase-like cupin family protein